MQEIFYENICNALSLRNALSLLDNKHIFIVAHSGHGKTIAAEAIAEKFFYQGYVVIMFTDTKDTFESAYCMFNPQHKYHIDKLQNGAIRKPIQSIPAKIYHPFTFEIPKKKLPDINWFTFSLKSLTMHEFTYIMETSSDSESVTLLRNVSRELTKTDNLTDFIHKIADNVLAKGNDDDQSTVDYGLMKPDKKNFWLRVGMSGNRATISDIFSHFLPFQQHYMLQPDNCYMNIDMDKLLSDNKHYHILSTYWIKDEKIKYFVIFTFFLRLMDKIREAKHPLLLVFEEVKVLLPAKSKHFHIQYMAQELQKHLSKIRNMPPKGCSTISTAQNYYAVHSVFTDMVNETLLGRLPPKDIDKLAKSISLDRDARILLSSLKTGQYIRLGVPYMRRWTMNMPSHAHREEKGLSFFQLYQKYYGNKMENYKEIIDNMEEISKQSDEEYKNKVTLQAMRKAEYLKKQKEIKEQQPKEESISEDIIKPKLPIADRHPENILSEEPDGVKKYIVTSQVIPDNKIKKPTKKRIRSTDDEVQQQAIRIFTQKQTIDSQGGKKLSFYKLAKQEGCTAMWAFKLYNKGKQIMEELNKGDKNQSAS